MDGRITEREPLTGERDIMVRRMPNELWHQVRVAAAQADIDMREYVIEALSERVYRHHGEGEGA